MVEDSLLIEDARAVLSGWREPADKRGFIRMTGMIPNEPGVLIGPTPAGWLIVGIGPDGRTHSGCRDDLLGLARDMAISGRIDVSVQQVRPEPHADAENQSGDSSGELLSFLSRGVHEEQPSSLRDAASGGEGEGVDAVAQPNAHQKGADGARDEVPSMRSGQPSDAPSGLFESEAGRVDVPPLPSDDPLGGERGGEDGDSVEVLASIDDAPPAPYVAPLDAESTPVPGPAPQAEAPFSEAPGGPAAYSGTMVQEDEPNRLRGDLALLIGQIKRFRISQRYDANKLAEIRQHMSDRNNYPKGVLPPAELQASWERSMAADSWMTQMNNYADALLARLETDDLAILRSMRDRINSQRAGWPDPPRASL